MTNEQAKAIRLLRDALHEIAYSKNLTGTYKQFCDYLQREADAALRLTESSTAAPIAAGVVPEEWADFARAFRGAFLNPVFRKKHGNEYTEDCIQRFHALADSIKSLAPAHPVADTSSGEVVAEVSFMPGISGFTMAVFKAEDVPAGSKVCVAAPASPAVATDAPSIPEAGAEELTDDEIDLIVKQHSTTLRGWEWSGEIIEVNGWREYEFVRAIIAALKGSSK